MRRFEQTRGLAELVAQALLQGLRMAAVVMSSGARAGVAAQAAVEDDDREREPGQRDGQQPAPSAAEAVQEGAGGGVADDHDREQPDEDQALSSP